MLRRLQAAFFGVPLFAQSHTFNGPTTNVARMASSNLNGTSGTELAIFANGCFWGTEHMFRHTLGDRLKDVKVGYCGGDKKSPTYREVCSGRTGHAEAIKVEFDPSKISYAELVEFHYRMHDPTTKDRQGPDVGSQYRSAIFTTSDEQEKVAKEVTAEVQEKHFQGKKIATVIAPAGEWYDAEDYHQRYLDLNPGGYECPTHRLYW